ncbi:MAG: hypothetical protein K6348_03285 [Deferribacterales bacterium]
MYNIPNLITADKNGNVYDHPYLKSVFKTGIFNIVPYELEMIPMPEKCTLKIINGIPYAYDQNQAKIVDYSGGLPVYTELPPGYLRTLMLSFIKQSNIPNTPYSHFTPVGWMYEKFVVPAIKIEGKQKIEPKLFERLKSIIQNDSKIKFLSKKSSLDFLQAGEIVINSSKDLTLIKPILDILNSNSIPHVITLKHIQDHNDIKKIKTEFTTINAIISPTTLDVLKRILSNEIDSLTFDIDSLNPDFYQNNEFDNIIKSFEISVKNGFFTSINLNTLPGFTDSTNEFDKLVEFLKTFKITYIKLRHMEVDTDLFFEKNKSSKTEILGLKNMLKYIKKKLKGVKIGYFSRTKDEYYLPSTLKIK